MDVLLAAFPREQFKVKFRSSLNKYALANPEHAGWTKRFLDSTPTELENSCWPE